MLSNFTSVQPTLNLDFTNTNVLDPRITFTRNSAATRFNSARILETVATNQPRFDYDPITLECKGLLIEESRTNRFANSYNSLGVIIGTGISTAPDGNSMLKAVCPSGAVLYPTIGAGNNNNQSFTLTNGQTIDISVSGYFAAGNTGIVIEPRLVVDASSGGSANLTYAELQINTSAWTVRAKSLGSDWTEVQAPSITPFSSDVYYVTWIVRYTQGTTIRDSSRVYCQLRDTTGSGTYTGDGIGHFQYFGIQGETGSFPTSTILTSDSAVTRAADVAFIDGISFNQFINQSSGTLMIDTFRPFSDSGNKFSAALFTSTTNYIGLDYTSGSNDVGAAYWRSDPAGSNTIDVSGSYSSTGGKYAIAYGPSDFAATANGLAPTTITPTYPNPSFTSLQFGRQTSGAFVRALIYMKRIIYYPTRFTSSELQALTAS